MAPNVSHAPPSGDPVVDAARRAPAATAPMPNEERGLARQMRIVRELHAQAVFADLLEPSGEKLVHDLRVALRRCRSLAQGLAIVDVSERRLWRSLATAGRALFQGLGALRDAQVMRGWFQLLVIDVDERTRLVAAIDQAISERVTQARAAIAAFDVVTWDSVASRAPQRAQEMGRRRPALLWLALVRWQEARSLHVQAMRRRTPEALHQVRIGAKRLRYTLESLLPERARLVHKAMKKLQEILGEIHDLDVASAYAADLGAPLAVKDLAAARTARMVAYRAFATGRTSAWTTLRAALPRRPDAIARCRRGYVLEVASSVGVDGRRARAAERAARVLGRELAQHLDPLDQLAVLLAPSSIRVARRACRQLLGFSPDEITALRGALRHGAVVRAAGLLTAPK